MMRSSQSLPIEFNGGISSLQSKVIDLDRVLSYSVQVNYADAAPAIKTFVDANVTVAADTITIAAHPYVTGTKVILTSIGVLPAGLALVTTYFVIKIDADTIKLASSLVNAQAGTAVDITAAAGGGTHTATATVSAGNVFKLQKNNDNVAANYADIASQTVTIATTLGTSIFENVNPSYRYLRLLFTPSAGQITMSCIVNLIYG